MNGQFPTPVDFFPSVNFNLPTSDEPKPHRFNAIDLPEPFAHVSFGSALNQENWLSRHERNQIGKPKKIMPPFREWVPRFHLFHDETVIAKEGEGQLQRARGFHAVFIGPSDFGGLLSLIFCS